MNVLVDALANLQIGPTADQAREIASQLSGLRITDRLTCPICGKKAVARENFWRHRQSAKCVNARAEMERRIQAGQDAMRRLIASEVIATSRK